MTYVVSENCIKCKYTDCIEVCPVDCFYEGENFLVINPDECIDCSLCVPACPAEAIYPDDELPKGEEIFIKINERLSQSWKRITDSHPPLPEADIYNGKKGKLKYLIE